MMRIRESEPGCPVGCKYCMVTHIDARRVPWQKSHRWGINKTLTFLNKLPGEGSVREMGIDWDLLAGDYLGFQGITDPFWPVFAGDLSYIVDLVHSTSIKKLVLVTKWVATSDQLKTLRGKSKVCLAVSVTGLDMLERTTTKDRLNVIGKAVSMGINVIPLIHPYIHGLSDLSFLPVLAELGAKQVAVKGFRYNDRLMGDWGRKLIPEEYLNEYRAAQENEVLLGADFVRDAVRNAGLDQVEFRDWVHRPNGVGGVGIEEAERAVALLMKRCVVSSSDPAGVYAAAVKRRIK